MRWVRHDVGTTLEEHLWCAFDIKSVGTPRQPDHGGHTLVSRVEGENVDDSILADPFKKYRVELLRKSQERRLGLAPPERFLPTLPLLDRGRVESKGFDGEVLRV